jgi:hypothetical protein
MPWTNEYESARAQKIAEIDQVSNSSRTNQKASKAAFLLHFHYASNLPPTTFGTPVRLSGKAANENTPAYQLPHAQAGNSPREAEHAADLDARQVIRQQYDAGAKPYKVTIELMGDKGSCDRCAATVQKLADDVARSYFPGAEVKANAFYQRQGQHELHSSYVGRQGTSQYGSPSSVPTRVATTPMWKDSYYPGETDHRHQTAPSAYTASVASMTDRSPYTTSDSSSARDSSPSNSDDSGKTLWSNSSDQALQPARRLPADSSSGRASFPNTAIPNSYAPSTPTFNQDLSRVTDNGVKYRHRATIGDLYVYERDKTGSLGLYDTRARNWTTYPGHQSKDYIRTQLANSGASSGQASSSNAAATDSHRKKKHSSGQSR